MEEGWIAAKVFIAIKNTIERDNETEERRVIRVDSENIKIYYSNNLDKSYNFWQVFEPNISPYTIYN